MREKAKQNNSLYALGSSKLRGLSDLIGILETLTFGIKKEGITGGYIVRDTTHLKILQANQ